MAISPIGMTPSSAVGHMPLTPLMANRPDNSPTIGRFAHGIEGFNGFNKPAPVGGSQPVEGSKFNNILTDALGRLNQTHETASALAEQAATGELDDIHDYMIAATQAQLTTDFAVQVRNRALESFNDIMRMQV